MDINARSDDRDGRSFEFRMENFRLFADSGWLSIAPLTCVVGRNSSGKSSILLALLLLKQSIENEVFGSAITPLALSGPYCDLGQFRDVVHNHKEESKISFSFRMPIEQLHEANRLQAPLIDVSVPRVSRLGRDPYRFYVPKDLKFKISGTAALRLPFSQDEPFGPSLSQCEFDFGNYHIRFTRTISGERRQHWRTYGDTSASKGLSVYPTIRSFFPIIDIRDRLPKTSRLAKYLSSANFSFSVAIIFRQ